MKPDVSRICFGLSEDLDRESLAIFLQLAGRKEFAETFAQRLSSEEIIQFSDSVMGLLRAHLSEDEYHGLFLNETGHNGHGG